MTERSGWPSKFRKLPHGRGVGIACSSYLSGAGLPINWNDLPHSGVQLKLDRSGGVTAFCGATEIGQGSDDVLVACVAEVLGIDPFDIRAVTGDTDLTPVDLGSYSSRVTLDDGQRGDPGRRARAAICSPTRSRAKLEVPKDRARVRRPPRVRCRGSGQRASRSRKRSASPKREFGTIGTTGSYTPPTSAAKFKGGGVGPSPTYSYTAAVVEVEVDPETGWIDVPRVWIAHDIGRALNPTLVRGQVEGSVYMGLGEALMEEQAFRRLPREALARARAQVPVDARIQEPDEPRHAGDRHRPGRASRSGRAVRREGSRPGAAAADHAGGRQRGVRRGRRADRRGADHAREDPEGARGEGRRQAGARTARRRFPAVPWPEPLLVHAAVGRRRRPRVERAREEVVAQGRRGRRSVARAVRR